MPIEYLGSTWDQKRELSAKRYPHYLQGAFQRIDSF